MTTPLVTAFVPSYNYARYLAHTLDSIVNQEYENWELVIVDDQSTDDSPNIIRTYAARYPSRIRAILLDSNVGPAAATNIGMDTAQGEFVTLIAADDIAKPWRMSRGVSYLSAHPDVGAVFSKVECIDHDGRRCADTSYCAVFNRPVRNIRWEMLSGNILCGTSCVARLGVLRDVQKYRPALRHVQDYDMWLRVMDKHEIARVDDVWVSYRLHGDNLSESTKTNPHRYAHSQFEAAACVIGAIRRWPLEKLFRFSAPPGAPLRRKEESAAFAALSKHCFELDKQRFGRAMLYSAEAYELALKAVDYDPENQVAAGLVRELNDFMVASAARPDRQLTIPQALDTVAQRQKSSDFGQAQQLLEGILAIEPLNSAALHLLGVNWLHRGDAHRARECFARAVELKADFAEAYNGLGAALGRVGRKEEALAAFERALAIRPEFEEARRNRQIVVGSSG